MKYTVTAIVAEDDDVSVEVSVRRGAKAETVFRKCMNGIGRRLIERGILQEGAKFKYDKPNVWRNGGFGAAWFCSPFIDVTIQEETGAWFAL